MVDTFRFRLHETRFRRCSDCGREKLSHPHASNLSFLTLILIGNSATVQGPDVETVGYELQKPSPDEHGRYLISTL
jgi:hypothetical protein